MQLSLFGATGRVGTRLLEYALAEGHAVRALARDAGKLAPRHGLEVIVGDVLDPKAVASAIIGTDAMLSAIGGAGLADPGVAQSQGMRNIVAAMQTLGVRRLLAVAGSGILDAPGGGLRHDQPGFPEVFKAVSLRHMEAWHAMRDSDLDWTMVCTGDIEPGERTGVYRTRDEMLPQGARTISVENVADFMLKEMTANAHLRRRVGLGY
ncbi:MAG: SDR family oxidoreductase [Gemmatimonadota bacterium]|nr:SDR family oxidoreductase [Gemmatimonadota bacterium]